MISQLTQTEPIVYDQNPLSIENFAIDKLNRHQVQLDCQHSLRALNENMDNL